MTRILKKVLSCGWKKKSLLSGSSRLREGHVRVYVGKDDEVTCRLEVEANYLNHPLFENLLQLSVEEFGYSYKGALRIACEIDLFHFLLDLLKSRNPCAHYMDFQDLISKFYNCNSNATSRKKGAQ